MAAQDPSHYDVLGVGPTATPDELKAAYTRGRARAVAENSDEKQLAGRLRALDQAYVVLSDAGRRSAYDEELAKQTVAPPGGAVGGSVMTPDDRLPVPTPPTQAVAVSAPSLPLAPTGSPSLPLTCPHCGAANPLRATMCVACGQQILRPCPNCAAPVPLGLVACPRCDTVLAEYDRQRFSLVVAVEQQITRERRMEDEEKIAADAQHHAYVWTTFTFWMVVVVLGAALIVLASTVGTH